MKRNNAVRALLFAAIPATVLSSGVSAAVITAWNFENQPITAPPPYNNSPTPSSGMGTASSIGMDLYATPNIGATSDDIIAGVAGDTGTNGLSDTTQVWRVRAQDGGSGAANGWSNAAPIGSQGAVFAASTVGFNAINVGFDWYSTKQGEAKLQLEYTTDGTTWHNTAVNPGPNTTTYLQVVNNVTPGNTVVGSYLLGVAHSAGQEWFPGLTATINDPLAVNNPNFAFELVNASTGADDVSMTGAALNNSSGNWRFDNVSISGTATATPEPSSIVLAGLGGLIVGIVRWRPRK